MHLFSIFVLAMGLAVTAFAEPSTGETQTAPPSLDRVTWVVNSCLEAESTRACRAPTYLREDDLLHLRRLGDEGVAIATLQSNGSELHIFDGKIHAEDEVHGLPRWFVYFTDDPVDKEPVEKLLTVQKLRTEGEIISDATCQQRLAEASNGGLIGEVAETVCDSSSFPNLVHWRVCVRGDRSDGCRADKGPPDDGQGTASGND